MLSFLVGMLLGGIITVTIMSILYISKYGEITESEFEMWEEHLQNQPESTSPSGDCEKSMRGRESTKSTKNVLENERGF